MVFLRAPNGSERVGSLRGGVCGVHGVRDCLMCEGVSGCEGPHGANFFAISARRITIRGISRNFFAALAGDFSIRLPDISSLFDEHRYTLIMSPLESTYTTLTPRKDHQAVIAEVFRQYEEFLLQQPPHVTRDLFLSYFLIDAFPPNTISEIRGDFGAPHTSITSLNNCPRVIRDNFYMSNTCIRSLVSGPDLVGGTYDARNCPLESLEGAPESCKVFLSNQYTQDQYLEFVANRRYKREALLGVDQSLGFSELLDVL